GGGGWGGVWRGGGGGEGGVAVMVEPVWGGGGFTVPPVEFFDALEQTCRKYGILLIADEVQTGFARTGRMFACEHFGLEPDLLLTAKTLGEAALATLETIERLDLCARAHDLGKRFHQRFTHIAHVHGLGPLP